MKDLIVVNGKQGFDTNLTMSSKQISDLVGSRHDNVKRTIDTLVNKGVIQHPQTEIREEINGLGLPLRTSVYLINERDSYVVVAQLSPEFTAKLVDEWQKLKSGVQLPNFTNPAEAAIAWAEQYRANEAAQAYIEQSRPKVDHYNTVVERDVLVNATQIGGKVGLSAQKLNKVLGELGIYNKKVTRSKVFNNWFVQEGFGILRQVEGGYTSSLFTLAGEAWIIDKLIFLGVVEVGNSNE